MKAVNCIEFGVRFSKSPTKKTNLKTFLRVLNPIHVQSTNSCIKP